MAKKSSQLTYDDCLKFRDEHPELLCRDIHAYYDRYYKAMRRLGILHELYPKKPKGKLLESLSYEDCLKFKNENPDITRKDLYSHHYSYFKAMERLGCLDSLYPPKKKPYSNNLTYEDCLRFRQEHPKMTRIELIKYHKGYHTAMLRHGCYDELFPSIQHQVKYPDEKLIEEARKYSSVKEIKDKKELKWLLDTIYRRGLKDKAFAHMKAVGNRTHRMIYVYEFSDNYAYIGLTYNIESRHYQHMTYEKSAVNKHMRTTGLTPMLLPLTDYIDVELARIQEGEYVEQYRKNGWNILNVEATGGIGGSNVKIDKKEIINLFELGYSQRDISEMLSVSVSIVYNTLRKSGIVYAKGRKIKMVEAVDKDGNVLMTFKSAIEAAKHFNHQDQTIRCKIRRHYFSCGCYLRYKEDAFSWELI